MKKTALTSLILVQSVFALSVMLPVMTPVMAASDWQGDTELGYVMLDGNSRSESLNGKLDVNREGDSWRNNFHLEAANSSSDEARTAEKYLASSQLDYKFTARSYGFSKVAYEEDHFSGLDYQAFVAAGYGRQIIESETMQFSGEIGPGYRVDEADDGNNEEDGLIYLNEKFDWKFSPSASFDQEIQVEKGQDNTISRLSVSVKSTLTDSLAMKVAYAIKYTQDVPLDKEHADTETTLTLVYGF